MSKKTKEKKAPVKRQKVHIQFLQDRSGSMQSRWDESLVGFKAFLDDLKAKDDVDYILSLTVFDTTIETPVNAKPIREVDPGILAAYPPRYGTSLYDALGSVLTAGNDADADKVICIIVTDGEENSSIGWTKDSIHSTIDEKIRSGKYTFQYLGSQPETWADAKVMGFSAGQTVTYDSAHVGGTYTVLASAVNNFSSSPLRSSRSMTASFADSGLLAAANMCVVKEDEEPSI